MRKINDIGLALCKIQAKVFEKISYAGCSSPVFGRRIVNSEVAKRMDRLGFLFESCEGDDILEEVETEFNSKVCGKEKYLEEELYWIYVSLLGIYTRKDS